MDNARFLIAIVLAVGVIILTNLLLAPGRQSPPATTGADTAQVADTSHARPVAPPAPAAAPAGTTAQKAAPPPPPKATPKAAAPTAGAARVSPPEGVAADTVLISSPLYRYAISTAGGTVVSAELLQFRSFTREGPVQLVPPGSMGLIRYRLQYGDSVVDLAHLGFHLEGPDRIRLAEGGSAATVRLVHTDSTGGPSVTLVYTFRPDSYRIGVSGEIRGGRRNGTLLIDLGPSLAMNEADSAADRRALGYAVDNTKQGIQSQSLSKLSSRHVEEGPLYWSAFKDKYFLAAVISSCGQSSDCFGGAIANPVTTPVPGVELTTTYPLPSQNTFAYQLYLGPQEHERLAALGHDMQDVNPYGWRVFRPILQPLTHVVVWALTTMHRVLDLGYGWVLIILGVLIRVILWPFNAKAMRSQLKNMELQPRIQEIQKKYKSEPERLQKEMMRLYKEEGFNPLGGCLPMLIPYPVLITLFFVFENTIALRGVGFLWLSDLSRPDPLYILPILLGLSMFALQYLSARSTPTTNPQMKMMMWLMPPFMTFIFLRLASGLNLYYAATNVASLPQQIQIMNERRRMRERSGS